MQNGQTDPVVVTRSCSTAYSITVQREGKFVRNKKAIPIKICLNKFSP